MFSTILRNGDLIKNIKNITIIILIYFRDILNDLEETICNKYVDDIPLKNLKSFQAKVITL